MKQLGEVAAVNASLNMLVADRDVALGHDGAGPDNERAIDFLTSSEYLDEGWGRLEIGGVPTLAFSLEGMTGMATVHKLADGRLLVVEPSVEELDEDEDIPDDYLAQVRKLALEAERQDELGALEIPSGILVIGDSYDSLSAHKDELMSWGEGESLPLEDHLGSLAIRVPAGRYKVTRTRELDLDWGEFSLAWIEPAE